MPDKGIKTGREGAGAVVSGKPLYNGRRKPAELMPAGTTAAFDHKVFKTTVAFGTLVLQPGSKAVTASVPCTVTTRHDGLLELTFALDAPCTVTISIHP